MGDDCRANVDEGVGRAHRRRRDTREHQRREHDWRRGEQESRRSLIRTRQRRQPATRHECLHTDAHSEVQKEYQHQPQRLEQWIPFQLQRIAQHVVFVHGLWLAEGSHRENEKE